MKIMLAETLALYHDDQRPDTDYFRPGDVLTFQWYTKTLTAVVIPWEHSFLALYRVGTIRVACEMGWTHEIPASTANIAVSRPVSLDARARNVEIAHLAVRTHYMDAKVWADRLESDPDYRFFPELNTVNAI